MPQAASMPSTGSEKSTRVVGLPTVSTSAKFGSDSAKGPNSRPSRFIVRKFSPLIQTRSTEPSRERPACFSARTRFTTSAVSAIFTCSSFTPWRFSTSPAAHCR